jgi:hypothetical protein
MIYHSVMKILQIDPICSYSHVRSCTIPACKSRIHVLSTHKRDKQVTAPQGITNPKHAGRLGRDGIIP